MGATANKLQAIADSKAAIKAAIEEKGVDVEDSPLSEYAEKIGQIQGEGSDFNVLDYLQEKLEEALITYAGEDYTHGNIFGWFAMPDKEYLYKGSNGLTNRENTSRILFSDGFTKVGQDMTPYFSPYRGYRIDASKDIDLPKSFNGLKLRYKINLYNDTYPGFFSSDVPQRADATNISTRLIGTSFAVSIGCGTAPSSMWDVPDLQMIRLVNQRQESAGSAGSFRGAANLWYLEGMDFTKWTFPVDVCVYKNIKNIDTNSGFGTYNFGVGVDSMARVMDALLQQEEGVTKTFNLRGQGLNLTKLQTFYPEKIIEANNKGWTIIT